MSRAKELINEIIGGPLTRAVPQSSALPYTTSAVTDLVRKDLLSFQGGISLIDTILMMNPKSVGDLAKILLKLTKKVKKPDVQQLYFAYRKDIH